MVTNFIWKEYFVLISKFFYYESLRTLLYLSFLFLFFFFFLKNTLHICLNFRVTESFLSLLEKSSFCKKVYEGSEYLRQMLILLKYIFYIILICVELCQWSVLQAIQKSISNWFKSTVALKVRLAHPEKARRSRIRCVWFDCVFCFVSQDIYFPLDTKNRMQ